MSKQGFTSAHRQAFWTAYGRKCFYCGEAVAWDGLRIDHLVPEYLEKDADALRSTLASVGLPESWNLHDEANLVPACDACNSRKSTLLPLANQMMLWTAQSRKKAPLVLTLRKEFETQQRRDITIARLEVAATLGRLTTEDVDRVRLAIDRNPDAPVRLPEGLRFFGDISLTDVRPSETNSFLDVPLFDEPFLQLVKPGAASIIVNTAREYRDATARGYQAPHNLAWQTAFWFQQVLGILTAIQSCRPAERSFIRDPRIGLCDLDLLPSCLLPTMTVDPDSPCLQALRKYPTVGELVNAGEARLVSVNSHEVQLEFCLAWVRFREILRADLDGDGCEDVLVWSHLKATGGTLSYGIGPYALARRGPNEGFTPTEIIPPPGVDTWAAS